MTAVEGVAQRYDRGTTGPLFARYREISERGLHAAFAEGQRVLDVGCGTGVEAVALARRGVRVVAVDVMPEMVEATLARADAAGVGGLVEGRVMAARDLGGLADGLGEGALDGAYSSFGALNCEGDLAPVAAALGRLLRPGARLLASVMGPACLWEMAVYAATLRPGKALRRLRPQRAPVAGRPFDVSYHSLRALERAFAPSFRVTSVRGYGLLPPPYLEGVASRFPRFLDMAAARDVAPLRRLGDHMFVTMQRV